jgi:hypothetical protein
MALNTTAQSSTVRHIILVLVHPDLDRRQLVPIAKRQHRGCQLVELGCPQSHNFVHLAFSQRLAHALLILLQVGP